MATLRLSLPLFRCALILAGVLSVIGGCFGGLEFQAIAH